MNRTQRRAGQHAQRRSDARMKEAKRRDVDRDLPASLQKLGLLPVNRGPYDTDFPRDPERTPVIRTRR